MSVDTAAAIRSRAELARRLAAQMYNDVTRKELLQLVDELLAEADKLQADRCADQAGADRGSVTAQRRGQSDAGPETRAASG
jgi:hypothetical protein